MSKLYDVYLSLKETDSKTFYLFKSGMFYIFLDTDAKFMSNLLNLKLTNFSPSIFKCGFPCNSLSKYLNLINNMNYIVKIIDTSKNIFYTPKQYNSSLQTDKLLNEIANINTDFLSVSEAYQLLDSLQKKAKELLT